MEKAVIVSCFGSYFFEERLQYVYKSLISNDYEVTILMSDYNHTQKREIVKGEYPDYVELINTRKYKKNISLTRVLSHLDFAWNLKKELKRIQPKFIYYLIPPNVVAKVVSDYAQNHDCYVVADIMDLWPESFPLVGFHNKINFIEKIWRSIRTNNIKKADYIIYECSYFKEELQIDKKGEVVYLPIKTFERRNCGKIQRDFNFKDLRIAYIGQISHIVDIEMIEKILSRLSKKYKVTLYVIGDGINYKKFINRMSAVVEKVYSYGPVYDSIEIKDKIGKCHFGLNIMKSNVQVGLTMKSMTYMGLGIPIINNISGDTWRLVEKKYIGINISNEMTLDIDSMTHFYKMHQNVVSLIDTSFSPNAIQSKFDDVIKKILK